MKSSVEKYSQAVELAKKILLTNKRDSLHDLAHIEAVWANCLALIAAEKLQPDLELLKIAVYWHDVVITEPKWPSKLNVDEVCEHLLTELPKLGFSEAEVNTIVLAVRYHEFRNRPRNLIGLILQDADKIDAASVVRGERMFQDYEQGLMTKEVVTNYMRTALKWISILDATFYFDYSRKQVKANITEFLNHPRTQEVITELGLTEEFETVFKQPRSIKTNFLRAYLRARAEFIKFLIMAT
ncbi:MAG TPA: HD domain-containing protein [Vitreimonas sp.]|nr:HD domain-containing protein [Vitreimonas sp.]